MRGSMTYNPSSYKLQAPSFKGQSGLTYREREGKPLVGKTSDSKLAETVRNKRDCIVMGRLTYKYNIFQKLLY